MSTTLSCGSFLLKNLTVNFMKILQKYSEEAHSNVNMPNYTDIKMVKYVYLAFQTYAIVKRSMLQNIGMYIFFYLFKCMRTVCISTRLCA